MQHHGRVAVQRQHACMGKEQGYMRHAHAQMRIGKHGLCRWLSMAPAQSSQILTGSAGGTHLWLRPTPCVSAAAAIEGQRQTTWLVVKAARVGGKPVGTCSNRAACTGMLFTTISQCHGTTSGLTCHVSRAAFSGSQDASRSTSVSEPRAQYSARCGNKWTVQFGH